MTPDIRLNIPKTTGVVHAFATMQYRVQAYAFFHTGADLLVSMEHKISLRVLFRLLIQVAIKIKKRNTKLYSVKTRNHHMTYIASKSEL
jgi:hypothetical protein